MNRLLTTSLLLAVATLTGCATTEMINDDIRVGSCGAALARIETNAKERADTDKAFFQLMSSLTGEVARCYERTGQIEFASHLLKKQAMYADTSRTASTKQRFKAKDFAVQLAVTGAVAYGAYKIAEADIEYQQTLLQEQQRQEQARLLLEQQQREYQAAMLRAEQEQAAAMQRLAANQRQQRQTPSRPLGNRTQPISQPSRQPTVQPRRQPAPQTRRPAPQQRQQPVAPPPMPSNCVSATARDTLNGVDLRVENRCGQTVDVNVCLRLASDSFGPSRNSTRLGAGSARTFNFVNFDNDRYQWRFRYCQPGRTTGTAHCPASC